MVMEVWTRRHSSLKEGMQLNMERVKGGGLLKYVEGPIDVVCGVVFMMVGRISPNLWP